MKRIGLGLGIVLAIVLVIPSIIIFWTGSGAPKSLGSPQQHQIPSPDIVKDQVPITVYRAEAKKVETYPIEQYIVGVVAAEMPADFELEALKAQAMAARTYIVRRLEDKANITDVPQGALVTDTIQHQVFIDDNQRKLAWGKDYSWKIDKVRQAVLETAAKVLAYDGQPINATFFSTSNGFTENSEEYWAQKIPYLRSVTVPWDKQSPKFETKSTITLSELEKKLGVKLAASAATTPSTDWSKVIQETTGNRVAKMKIGDKVFTGREIREKLGLPSTAFTWKLDKDHITITVHGSGHGVGMSQWGANGMAHDGKKADEIVKYFYSGITIEDYHKWVKNESTTNLTQRDKHQKG